jgi:hypothetical protein
LIGHVRDEREASEPAATTVAAMDSVMGQSRHIPGVHVMSA